MPKEKSLPELSRKDQMDAVNMLQDCVIWFGSLRKAIPDSNRNAHRILDDALFSLPDHTQDYWMKLTNPDSVGSFSSETPHPRARV